MHNTPDFLFDLPLERTVPRRFVGRLGDFTRWIRQQLATKNACPASLPVVGARKSI